MMESAEAGGAIAGAPEEEEEDNEEDEAGAEDEAMEIMQMMVEPLRHIDRSALYQEPGVLDPGAADPMRDAGVSFEMSSYPYQGPHVVLRRPSALERLTTLLFRTRLASVAASIPGHPARLQSCLQSWWHARPGCQHGIHTAVPHRPPRH